MGPGHPCFVIAEAGVNHNGDIEKAFCLIDAACDAKADAVKFQTFKAKHLVAGYAPKAGYQRKTTGAGSQFDMLKKLELSFPDFQRLKNYCDKKGILFLSTPFDEESADFLEEIGVAIFKIPSGELTNLPFLSYVAKKKKRMIVSTGMSCLEEVEAAVKTIRQANSRQLVLLHCVSQYPAKPQHVNLKAMETLREEFKLPVGYSDHTLGIDIALAAAALGACVIEKHFTLDRNLPGPDHKASLNPEELKSMVLGIRNVETALGSGKKEPAAGERDVASVSRRSLVAARTIPLGTRLSMEWIAIRRPGTGISPTELFRVMGKTVKKEIPEGDLLTWEALNR